jgi:hypothetical protein
MELSATKTASTVDSQVMISAKLPAGGAQTTHAAGLGSGRSHYLEV